MDNYQEVVNFSLPSGVVNTGQPPFLPRNIEVEDGWYEELDVPVYEHDRSGEDEVVFTHLWRTGGYTTTKENLRTGEMIPFAIWMVADEDENVFCVYLDKDGDFIDDTGYDFWSVDDGIHFDGEDSLTGVTMPYDINLEVD